MVMAEVTPSGTTGLLIRCIPLILRGLIFQVVSLQGADKSITHLNGGYKPSRML